MTKGGAGINSGGPDTDDMVTRSPLPTVSTGAQFGVEKSPMDRGGSRVDARNVGRL